MVSAKDNAAEAGIHQSDVKWDDTVTKVKFNVNDGLTGRDGGPYLDEVEARDAEKRRAAIEGREPDLENPGPTAGTYLVTGAQLLSQANVPNIPSQDDKDVVGVALSKAFAGDDFLPVIQGELPDQAEIDKILEEARANPVESELASDSRAVPAEVNDEDATPHQTPRKTAAKKTAAKKTTASTKK